MHQKLKMACDSVIGMDTHIHTHTDHRRVLQINFASNERWTSGTFKLSEKALRQHSDQHQGYEPALPYTSEYSVRGGVHARQ